MSPNHALPGLNDLPRRLFTPDEVMRMVEAGILSEEEHVELIEGVLVEVTPQGPPHANLLSVFHRRLSIAYGPDLMVRVNSPIHAGERSLPEPDLAVVRGGERTFAARHPRADETLLVIEVTRTSHALERLKVGLYARAGAPVYWLVDVPARRIEVYEDPQPDGRYQQVRVLRAGDVITPPGSEAAWELAELLP